MLFDPKKHAFTPITRPLVVSFIVALVVWPVAFWIFGKEDLGTTSLYFFVAVLVGVIAGNVQERKRNWSLIEIIMLFSIAFVGSLISFFVLEYLGYFQQLF